MIGIVGINAIAEAISAYARASLGIAVIHCHAGAIADDIIHAGASDGVTNPRRYVRLEEAAQMTSVFCFALPWTREAGDWLRWYWPRPARQQRTLIVAWRRSSAVERALAYLGEHLADEVHLPALAAQVGLSKFHLVRLFRSTLGVTPHRCQLLLRLSRAKAMLRQGVGIAEVALALGFCDQSHLDRTFRLLGGMTPSRYQMMQGNFFQDGAGNATR